MFDFEELKSSKKTQLPQAVPLKRSELHNLPKLNHVWSNEPPGIISFQSPRQLNASDCQCLTSIFPASIAKSMPHLEELQIEHCGIDVIVAKDEVSESDAITFVFPKLTSLYLCALGNLGNFYPQRHTSKWPSLKLLSIADCEELEIFEDEVSSSSAIQEEGAHNSKYRLFFHEKVPFK